VRVITVKPTIAAFDFDGTLTYCDSLFFFVLYAAGMFKALFHFLLVIPKLASYLLGRVTRQQFKEQILQQFFIGTPIGQVRKCGEEFARKSLFRLLRPKGLHRVQWHRNKGHRCILISASIDAYLEPWAKLVGFHDTLTSRLETDAEGKVTGKLVGLNCRGEEKVRRLKELLGCLENYCIYAYGDSDGDKELLEIADHPFFCSLPVEEL